MSKLLEAIWTEQYQPPFTYGNQKDAKKKDQNLKQW